MGRLLDLILSHFKLEINCSLAREDGHHPALIIKCTDFYLKTFNFKTNLNQKTYNFRGADFPNFGELKDAEWDF